MNAIPLPKPFEPVMARLHADVPRVLGSGALEFVPTEVQDRPFSLVLRLAVRKPEQVNPVTHLFVKIFKMKSLPGGPDAMQQRVARDFASTRQAYEAMRDHVEIAAVHPIACYPELLAIVTEESPGQTLLAYLESSIRFFPSAKAARAACDTMVRVGHWMQVFQQVNPDGPVMAVREFEDYIDIRLQRLIASSGGRFTDRHRDGVLAHVRMLGHAAAPHDLRRATAHSDLSLGNILVSDRGVVVLDFAMTRLDSWVYDVAKVTLQLELMTVKPQFRSTVIASLQAALRAGFDPRLAADAPMLRLMTLLHRINHLGGAYERRASGREAIYNRLVRRHHHRRLREELGRHAG